jgi:hypothetical protein
VTFHPHVLTSPDRAAVVEENRHFISNRAMVTSVPMQPTNKMGSAPQNGIVEQDFHVLGDAEALGGTLRKGRLRALMRNRFHRGLL